jgi:glutamate/tyrosine decarboxylase-like PLP-dependent enzyme
MEGSAAEVRIPDEGIDRGEVLAQMREYREADIDWRSAKAWSLVYHLGDEHSEFLKKAHNLFFSENALNPVAFRSLKRFESEVIRMTANLFHGDPEVVGTMTSGGTESLLLTVQTYRDKARADRGIGQPEIVLPTTAHAAFDKAGHYFGVKIVHVPVGDDFRADVKAMEKRINTNTILLVGSAPSYPHGVIDPIEDLAALARKHRIGFHVDACLGGFLVPFVEKLGYPIPPFDFRVPGVTSMSADVHKYGYGAKGASTVMYRGMDILKHQFFICGDWPGGVYVSATMPGTRPGGPMAAAWAAMRSIGMKGYLQNAKLLMDTTRRLIDGINAIPELYVLGKPDISVFAFASKDKDIDCFAVADRMEKKGWHIDRQHRPACLHCMVNPAHAAIVDEYLTDLREAVAYVKANPETSLMGSAPTYGLIAKVPLRGMIAKNIAKIMESMYTAEGKMPSFTDESDEPAAAGDDVPAPLMAALRVKLRVKQWLRRITGRA